MYDSSYVPPPSIDEKPKAPILGILSCAAAVLSVLFFCGIFVLTLVVGSGSGFDVEAINSETLTNLGFGILGLMCASGVSTLVGLALGALALVIHELNKVWGIIGLILNGLIVFGFCVFVGLGVLAA
jgi:hypothetical protein